MQLVTSHPVSISTQQTDVCVVLTLVFVYSMGSSSRNAVKSERADLSTSINFIEITCLRQL